MKNAIIAIILFISVKLSAQVGIGTTSPNASSELDIVSTTKGALMPRMTESQRTSILSPAIGLLVFQTDNAAGFYYHTGSAWTNLTNGGSGGTPSGSVTSFAGATAPEGWLLCDGSAVSRSVYASLFSVIGTIYGTGNGSTTFNLPDLRGRTVFGKDNMGGVAASRLTTTGGISANNTLGATGGNQTTTLITDNIPAHTHTFTGSSVTTSSNSHSHTYQDAYFAEAGGGGVGGNSIYGTSANTDTDNSFRFRTSSNGYSNSGSNINTSSESHTHTVTAAGTLSNTGNGTAFQSINPGIVLNYIIKL